MFINIGSYKQIKYAAVVVLMLSFLVLFYAGSATAVTTAHNDFFATAAISPASSNCLKSASGEPANGCHDLHEAPAAGLQGTRTDSYGRTYAYSLLADPDEKEVCFSCHDGTSGYDTKDDFGQGYGYKTSAHNVFDSEQAGFLLCSDCHTSHMVPDDGEPADGWKGNEVIALLRVVISNVWNYLINEDNDEWLDTEDQKALGAPSDFCGGCHDSQNNYFVGNLHDTGLSTPATNRSTTSTMIECGICHQWHAADNYKLLASNINGMTVSANDNGVCFSCHDDANGVYQAAIYTQTKHFTVTSPGTAAVNYSAGYGAGYCLNCHDPHGTQFNDFRREKNALCFQCHDALTINIPDGYSYRGQDTYAISAHADAGDNDTKWPVAADTGNAVGGGGGASAGECINCHSPMGKDDGSGTPFAKLLTKWSAGSNSNEQLLCFGGNPALGKCHADGFNYNQAVDNFYGMTSQINIYDKFSVGSDTDVAPSGAKINTRHDISKNDQDYSGAKVECSNCHNTHINNKIYNYSSRSRISDPDDTNRNYVAAYQADNEFSNGQSFDGGALEDSGFGRQLPDFVNYCLRCHDNNSLPSGVQFGSDPTTNILPSYANPNINNADKHGRGIASEAFLKSPYETGGYSGGYTAMNCIDCHDSHGSSNLYGFRDPLYINGEEMTAANTVVDDNTYGGRTGWCMTCHSALPDSGPDDHTPPAYNNCGDCHYHGSNF